MKQFSTKYLLLAILMAMAWLPSRAQLVLVREVVANSGGSETAGNISIDYTIGEPVVQSFSGGGMLLTQGFQQREVLPLLPPGAAPIMDFMLFPNPALTTVKIGFNLLTDASVVFLLVNSLGQVMHQDIRMYGPGKIVIPVPVDKLAAGIYTVVFKVHGQVYTEKLIIQ